MTPSFHRHIASTILGVSLVAACAWRFSPASPSVTTPVPAFNPASTASLDTAVFAGGCFWGMETVFEHVRGVTQVTPGYAGGAAKTAEYELVSNGNTGHAESVQVIYDPAKVSYGDLLRVFFSSHNPTELNMQGPDHGSQYRSVVFYGNEAQHDAATGYVAQMTKSKTFSRPIVTQIVTRPEFYPAEAYHQHFAERHPDHPYIVRFDLPKVSNLKKVFPDLYQEPASSAN